MGKIAGVVGLLVFLFLVVGKPFYTVDEREQAIILQFGKPVGVKTEPGLKVKVPFIQTVIFFPKNLLEWDGDPGQIPTGDKTFIEIDSFARWRIVDPLEYFKTVRDEIAARERLGAIVESVTNDFITSNTLIEVVRSSNRLMKAEDLVAEGMLEQVTKLSKVKLGREQMTRGILERVREKMSPFGIEVVDFRIKRINYVEDVRKKVYERMIAERKQISQQFRSEGMGESRRIEGEQQKELRRIKSEAYRMVEEIKGKADADATRIYAEAYNRDPEFYSFVNTLDLYKKSLDGNISLIMSTESEFFKYLKDYNKQ
jgi:modulator of FtsH protease HflC